MTEVGNCNMLRVQNTAERSWYFYCKTHNWTSPRCYDKEDETRFLGRHAVDVSPPPAPAKPPRVWARTRARMEAAEARKKDRDAS